MRLSFKNIQNNVATSLDLAELRFAVERHPEYSRKRQNQQDWKVRINGDAEIGLYIATDPSAAYEEVVSAINDFDALELEEKVARIFEVSIYKSMLEWSCEEGQIPEKSQSYGGNGTIEEFRAQFNSCIDAFLNQVEGVQGASRDYHENADEIVYGYPLSDFPSVVWSIMNQSYVPKYDSNYCFRTSTPLPKKKTKSLRLS